ncbi:glycosyltransferase family 4 protein [Muricomes intestini]|jgi:glycosyltransferase involved in cell wall biosynthesis|uniref:glycosyltransferase family 4 protein n=1 Tax=Muricomes intestini TaxID=1796634 RepID=UPI000E905BF7|nr:hypothetical protein [Lachnospiraceae bacterium]HCR84548.1 hypothetical protein [Lachnospiraceae bacterium]
MKQVQKDENCISIMPKRIVTLPGSNPGWSNVELIKDCGLIPWLLHKNHGHDVSMVGYKREDDYPYLRKYVKGLKMEFLPDESEEARANYILENANQIDCLILRGCYTSNFVPARLYKQTNPKGRIYVGLDANSHWMDRIIWNNPNFTQFMDDCDVIATSCRAMQRHLNEKWPWIIEHIPNGYYNFGPDFSVPEFEEKENVILTVSRLGTTQKATEILMRAFAIIAGEIPSWNLKLVGNVDEKFRSFIERYFKTFPKLKKRVLFTGPIVERDKLAEQYRKAKIFALPSKLEGGTPNVIAEALIAGCATAVTKFDAYEQAIDGGKCGTFSEIDDIRGFANVLLSLCKDKNLPYLSEHAYQYAKKCLDMEKITTKLNYMLFGGRE